MGNDKEDDFRRRFSGCVIEIEDNSVGGTNGQYDDISYRAYDEKTGELVGSDSERGRCDNR
jgi:hypothetical protein